MHGMRGVMRLMVVVALCAPVPGGAQEPPQAQGPTFRTGIDLVRVDVSVTGRDETAIADLRASDFEIREDGVPQAVQTLQFVRLDGTRTSDLDESLEIRSPEHAAREAARDDVRLFAIFLDDYHVDRKPYITQPMRQALKGLVEQFGPNDLIAVMDPLTPLSHLKFTRSRDELLERMAEFEGRRGELFPVRSVLEEAQHQSRNPWEVRGAVTLSAVGALVTHLGGLREGRKSVLVVSQGPVLGRMGSLNYDLLREAVQAANRGNVTVHVFDPRPLGDSPLGGADALHRLYTETGGRAIINTNAPGDHLGQIVADASAYYLLGYSPAREPADGRFHRIDVSVRRPGVRVRARSGYWAPDAKEMTAAAPAAPADPGLIEALTDLATPRGGRLVDVWLGASRGEAGLTRMTVAWEPADRPGARAPARLVVGRIRGSGDIAQADMRTLSAGTSHASVGAFDLEAGTTTLRFTAEADDGGVLDQWHQAVDVPRFEGAPLALGTPRFLRARTAFEARAMARGEEPAPAASRRFRKTDRVVVDVECYAPGAATLTAELLNSRGDRLTTLDVPPVAHGRTRVTLPLASVAPGTYVLRLQASAGEHHIAHRSAFRVIP